MKAGVVFIITGAGLVLYFREERARMERKRIASQTKGIGKPKVGGPFSLVDHQGRPFSNEDLKDKYALVSELVEIGFPPPSPRFGEFLGGWRDLS
jgi:protein SCO1/2